MQRLTVLDLFCGAGGLSLGFKHAGYELLHAEDNEPAAVQTYRTNLGAHVVCKSAAADIHYPAAAIVIGGPPCQGFSSAGLRRSGDVRNTLVGHFARVVATLRPVAFVFENVEGFLTSEEGSYVFDLLTPVIEAGYRVHIRKVNAANYGVPQHRKRVIAVGGRGWSPSFPQPTHTAYGAPGAALAARHLPRTPSIMAALYDLPYPSDMPPGEPPGHFIRPLLGLDLARAQALKPGQRMRDLPEDLWHSSYRRRAYRRVMDGTPTERRGGAPFGIRRLMPDQPCKAITSGARTEFIHPYEHRNLTIRELARIQTFADEFMFMGSSAQQEQLIGNAVPPRLAEVLARSLAADLQTASPDSYRGALLSFVPTLSTGMSPILATVDQRVCRAFPMDTMGTTSAQQLAFWR